MLVSKKTKLNVTLMFLFSLGFIFGPLAFEDLAYSATVDRCFKESSRCIIKLQGSERGSTIVGSRSFVLDHQVRPVASGWVVKAIGGFAVVTIDSNFSGVELGSPVLIKTQKQKSVEKNKPKSSRYVPMVLVPVKI